MLFNESVAGGKYSGNGDRVIGPMTIRKEEEIPAMRCSITNSTDPVSELVPERKDSDQAFYFSHR